MNLNPLAIQANIFPSQHNTTQFDSCSYCYSELLLLPRSQFLDGSRIADDTEMSAVTHHKRVYRH